MKRTYFWVLFGIVVALFFVVNDAIPMLYDDLPYAYYFPDHITDDYSYRYEREMTSAWEIIPSQVNHYILHGGRVIVHGLVQLFCYGEHKTAYNIFATLLFALLIPLLGKICFPKNAIRNNMGLALLSFLLLFIYVDSPNVLYHGIAFGINYLYSITVWLLFIYLLCNRNNINNVIEKSSLALLAILAGWSHEGFSSVFCSALLVWGYVNRKKITGYQKILICLCCISAFIMVIAPGNFHRAEGDANHNYGVLLIPAIYNYTLFIIIGVLALLRYLFKHKFDAFIKENIHLCAGWFVSVLFLSYIGMGEGRAAFGMQLVTFILFMRLLDSLGVKSLLGRIAPLFSAILIVLLGIIIYYQRPAGKEYAQLYAECESPKDTVVYCFSDAEIPSIIKPFICQHTFEDRYWDARYSLKYKKPIFVTDAPVVNFEYSEKNHESGESNFYRLNDYLLSQERLPLEVPIRLHQGGYQKWDMPTVARRVYFTLRPKTPEPLDVVLPSDSICIGADKYVYFISLPLKESARKITAVDYPIIK